MNFLSGFCSFLMSFAVVLFLLLNIWMSDVFDTPYYSSINDQNSIIVSKGDSSYDIAYKLEDMGAISDSFYFALFSKFTGSADKLKVGEYFINSNSTINSIISKMRNGDVYRRYITIAEGLTSYEVAKILNENTYLSGPYVDTPIEGSVLPETYSFVRGESREQILNRMIEAMNRELSSLWSYRSKDIPLSSPYEALILASIVEKESGYADKKSKVAGVFINRLKTNMLLQADPTVIYALTKGVHENEGMGPLGRRLLRKDLKIDSPYNTYLYGGLPPTPIANPGKEAIKAVMHPDPHNYYYFVANGKGGHEFASTLDEHNRNVQNWRKIRNSQ